MKIIKIISIILILFCLYSCEDGEIVQCRFEFKTVYYNSENEYSFERIWPSGHTTIDRFYFGLNQQPRIFYDADTPYCTFSKQEQWDGSTIYRNVRIHLRKDGAVNGGVDDRGKFGRHRQHRIK